MIDTVSIRNRILDLAFQGKLYSMSDDNDTVDKMLKNIPAPSAKRSKLLSIGSSVKFPYDIPDHWRCVPLGVISTYGDKVEKTKANIVDKSTWVLELEDIASGGGLLAKKRAIDRHSIGEKSYFKAGQILYSKLRPYLKKVILADESGICTPELVAFDVLGGIDPLYILFYLVSPFVDKVINMRSYGIKMPRVDSEFMANLPVPIPTLNEQKEIVTRIGKAFELLDIISMNQKKYETNKEALKAAIIDCGVSGKLTKRLPDDGTAEEFYSLIQMEKQRLIKEKKIKKDKPLLDMDDSELFGTCPKEWKMVRLGEVIHLQSGQDLTSDLYSDEEIGIPYLTGASNFNDNGDLIINRWTNAPKSLAYRNDVLLSVKGTVGKLKILDYDSVHIARQIMAIRGILIDKDYLKYYLESQLGKIKRASKGLIPGIERSDIRNMIIALPPLKEQKRIVIAISSAIELLQIENV